MNGLNTYNFYEVKLKLSQYPCQRLKYKYWMRKIILINVDTSGGGGGGGEGGQQIRAPADKGGSKIGENLRMPPNQNVYNNLNILIKII